MSFRLFLALLLGALFMRAEAIAQSEPWIGRWYADDPKVCSGRSGATEGLLTYTATKFIGYENECLISRKTQRGNVTHLTLECYGEGEKYREQEFVSVSENRLKRSVTDNGKRSDYYYRKCPSVSEGKKRSQEIIKTPGPLPKTTETIVFLKGTCASLSIAGRNFKCKLANYYHTAKTGRSQVTVVVDDPDDEGHVISFSGGSDRMTQTGQYELQVDRVILSSIKSKKSADGLPIPRVELAGGLCTVTGNFDEEKISSFSCKAMDRNGQSYTLEILSDGSPTPVKRF